MSVLKPTCPEEVHLAQCSTLEDARLRLPALPKGTIRGSNSALYDTEYSIELPGYKRVGLVRVCKQIHANYFEDYQTLSKIGTYQAQVFNHLIDTRPHHHLFLEGLLEDFPDTSSKDFSTLCYDKLWTWYELRGSSIPEKCLDHVREHFKDYNHCLPPTRIQKYYLGALTASFVYAICFDNVSLHKTSNPDFEARIRALQERPDLTQERRSKLIYDVRERMALRRVGRFLEHNPGAEAVLEFGNLHDFSRQASNVFDKKPLILSCDWPELTRSLGWTPLNKSADVLLN